MPHTGVVFYQEAPGDVPALNWLRRLHRTDRRGYEEDPSTHTFVMER